MRGRTIIGSLAVLGGAACGAGISADPLERSRETGGPSAAESAGAAGSASEASGTRSAGGARATGAGGVVPVGGGAGSAATESSEEDLSTAVTDAGLQPPDGLCAAFPEPDAACPVLDCPEPTPCRSYRPPPAGACEAPARCAPCEPVNRRRGIFCGVGDQCDGAGSCVHTGEGLVSAGEEHTCALTPAGNVRCWGDNQYGQLGGAFDRPMVGDDEAPASVPDLEIDFAERAVSVSAGGRHACALLENGAVRCWGGTFEELLELSQILGTNRLALTESGFVDPLGTGPVQLAAPALRVSLARNGAHGCAVLEGGLLSCWGFNNQGQLGYGHNDPVGPLGEGALPLVALPAPGVAIDVSLGGQHTCALLADGGVTCWGDGGLGRLGYGNLLTRLAPDGRVDVGGPVARLSLGRQHSCALLENGNARCWGRNDYGQLGRGHELRDGENQTPASAAQTLLATGLLYLGGDVQLGGNVRVLQLAAFEDSTCARTALASVHCWGRNHEGQLGYGHARDRGNEAVSAVDLLQEMSEAVPLGARALALAEGGRCVVLEDGSLRCFGSNDTGQLGLGDPELGPEPSLGATPDQLGPVPYQPSLGESD